MKPHVEGHAAGLVLSYELATRIYAVKVYPIQAPNGSTIIIYGHDFGIRILWRGGRPFKDARKESSRLMKPEVNGASKDTVMIIDADDEEPSGSASVLDGLDYEAEFDSDEDQYSAPNPHDPIIQHLDLNIGAAVQHLAVPSIPPTLNTSKSEYVPKIFRQEIVVSIACSDGSVRTITIPLNPPSAAKKAAEASRGGQCLLQHGIKGFFGELMVILSSKPKTYGVPDTLDMTWTSPETDPLPEDAGTSSEELSEDEASEARSGKPRSRSYSGGRRKPRDWALLIAFHSPEASGVLRTFQLAIVAEGHQDTLSAGTLTNSHTQYLAYPATSITFSPRHYPSTNHSQLLLADKSGAVRMFDCHPFSTARSRPARRMAANGGIWQFTFLAPYEVPQHARPSSLVTARRKMILAAKWIFGGRAVLALLEDGEWGIWEIEPVAPVGRSLGHSGGHGIRAGGTTKFALHGFLGNSQASLTASVNQSEVLRSKGEAKTRLAPMTPHTRKVQESSLFSGPADSTTLTRGGISLAGENPAGPLNESVIFWYGSSIYIMNNVMAYWQRSVSGSGGGGTLHGPGLRRIDQVDLHGELINEVQHMGHPSQAGLQERILVAAEHRLVISESSAVNEPGARQLFGGDRAREPRTRDNAMEKLLLRRGELDISGMDRLLDSMQEDDAARGMPRARKVGFVV